MRIHNTTFFFVVNLPATAEASGTAPSEDEMIIAKVREKTKAAHMQQFNEARAATTEQPAQPAEPAGDYFLDRRK